MTLLLKDVHFLIAEDNPTNQIVIAKIVEGLGGSFDMASDGLEAIHLYNPKHHDIALLDIEMPKKSGLEVIQHIRSRPDTPENFPIAALTAFVLADHRTKIKEAGADLIIAKPIVDVKKFAEDLKSMKDSSAKMSGNVQIFDSSSLLSMEESIGREVMPELLGSLITDLSALAETLDGLSTKADAEALKSCAHGVISLAATAGANPLSVEARAVEQRALENSEEDNLNGAMRLEANVKLLIDHLQDFGQRYE